MDVIDKKYWPICKTCNKEVEGFGVDTDIQTMRQIFTALCHGMMEQCMLTDEFLKNGHSVEKGYAFDPNVDKYCPKTGNLIEKNKAITNGR